MTHQYDQTSQFAELAARLAGLERQNARWRKTAFACLIIMMISIAAGALQQDDNETIEAEAFVVRDANGQARAMLSMANDEPMFALYSAEGNTRVALSVTKGGSGLTINDEAGKPRCGIALLPDGVTELGLTDSAGNLRARLNVSDEIARLMFADSGGNPRAMLFSNPQVTGLACADDNRQQRMQLLVGQNGPVLGMHDAEGRLRNVVSVFADTGPDIRILDEAGEPVFNQPERPE